MDLLIPDLSEWQGTVDWPTLIGGGYPAAIIRAYNGQRPDLQFEHNRQQAHAHGIRALGLYAYLDAGRSVADQAAEFVHLVSPLQAGEWPICDYEAAGLTPADAQAWTTAVGRSLGVETPWLYASEYVYRSEHLAQSAGVPAQRTWLAAWGPTEPTEGHELWQYTDHRTVPGVGGPVDCSTFHGDITQLLAAVTGRQVPTPPRPTPGPTSHPRFPYPAGIHPDGWTPSARPLQQALKRTGWMDGGVIESDHYGPITQRGVAGFNLKHGYNDTGIEWDPAIGPHGWALLMTLAYGAS